MTALFSYISSTKGRTWWRHKTRGSVDSRTRTWSPLAWTPWSPSAAVSAVAATIKTGGWTSPRCPLSIVKTLKVNLFHSALWRLPALLWHWLPVPIGPSLYSVGPSLYSVGLYSVGLYSIGLYSVGPIPCSSKLSLCFPCFWPPCSYNIIASVLLFRGSCRRCGRTPIESPRCRWYT